MSHHTVPQSPKAHPTSGAAPTHTGQRPPARSASQTEIAKRAYQKYEARGRAEGFALDDWFAAAHELTRDTFSTVSLPSSGQSPRAL